MTTNLLNFLRGALFCRHRHSSPCPERSRSDNKADLGMLESLKAENRISERGHFLFRLRECA